MNKGVFTQPGSLSDIRQPLGEVRIALENGHGADIAACLRCADTVAKVVSHWWSKILRAADAIFV